MLFSEIAVLLPDGSVESGMYVQTEEDKIVYVGKERPAENRGRIYPGKNRLLLPAFFNAHAHTPMTLLRGFAEGLPLRAWLDTRVFPFEARLTGEAVYYGMLLGLAEGFASGIVSSSDSYYFPSEMARAVLDSGAKGNISRHLTGDVNDKSFREMQDFVKAVGKNDRVKCDVCVHGEYSSSPAMQQAAARFAADNGLRMQIHLSETAAETEGCLGRYGKTPTAHLAEMGLFDVPCTAAHGVYLTSSDRTILREKGVFIASCPISNLKLGSGICNVATLLSDGVAVVLGTDGAASGNTLSMPETIKQTALLASLRDPAALPPEKVLAMACQGAAAQGRMDSGRIEAGARADLVIFRTDSVPMTPAHSVINNIVYAAGRDDVVLTVADGRILYENGEFLTIDIEKVKYEAARHARLCAGA